MEKKPGESRYSTSAGSWTRELLAMFVLGLVLATAFWLGLWFFHTKPSQAAALLAQKAALKTCLAEKALCNQVKGNLEAENREIRKQLD